MESGQERFIRSIKANNRYFLQKIEQTPNLELVKQTSFQHVLHRGITIAAQNNQTFESALNLATNSFRVIESNIIALNTWVVLFESMQEKCLQNQYENRLVIYFYLGQLYRLSNDFTQAITYHKEHLKIALQLKSPHDIAEAYIHLGNCYFLAEDIPLAQNYAEKSIKILREHDLLHLYSAASNLIGIIMHHIENYADARTYFEQALNMTSLEPLDKAHIHYNLANCLRGQQLYPLAKEQYVIAQDLFTEMNAPIYTMQISLCLSYLAIMQNSFESAYKILKKIDLLYLEKHNRPKLQARALNNLGYVCLQLDKLVEAHHYLSTSINLLEKLDDKPELANVLDSMADYYVVKNDIPMAITYLDRALGYLMEAPYPTQLLTTLKAKKHHLSETNKVVAANSVHVIVRD